MDVSVVTSGHDVADARLHRVAAALLRNGLQVEVLGLGSAKDAPAGVAVRTVPRAGGVGRALTAVRWAVRARGRVLFALDPDSALACLVVARATRRAVVADVHEDYLALLRDRAWARGWRGRVASQLARTATRGAARCDLVVVADQHVPPLRGRRRLVVRNLPDLAMLPLPAERDSAPRALYVGDVRGSRGLWSMLEAVAQAPQWTLDLVGPVAASDEAALARHLGEHRLGERIRLHGRMAPRSAWEIARGAWCGLALLEDTPAFRDALPSKLFEYLACGLAVIVTDLPRQRELVESLGVGAVVGAGSNAAAATAAQLRLWAERPDQLERHRQRSAAWRASKEEASEYDLLADRVRALLSARG